jgi:hypothetical protein
LPVEIGHKSFKDGASCVDAHDRRACEGEPRKTGEENSGESAMRVDVQPLVEERDRLENKRDRLKELLADGSVSDQMRTWLRQNLGEVNQRLAMLAASPVEMQPQRLAA